MAEKHNALQSRPFTTGQNYTGCQNNLPFSVKMCAEVRGCYEEGAYLEYLITVQPYDCMLLSVCVLFL
jgi:hypothetical protein